MLKLEALGLKETQRFLLKKKNDLKKELKEAFRKAGKLMVSESKKRTPVDTGKLQKSIKFRATRSKVVVYSKLPYAAAVHWGRKRQGKGGPLSRRTRFIYDALVANREKIRKILEEATKKVSGS